MVGAGCSTIERGDVMTAAARVGLQRSSARELESIERLVARLKDLFSEVDPAIVERAVRGEYAEFDDSAIRDFVPVLVERRARTRLNGATTSARHRA